MSASLSAKSKPQIKDAPPHQVDLIRVTGRRKEIFFSFGDFFLSSSFMERSTARLTDRSSRPLIHRFVSFPLFLHFCERSVSPVIPSPTST
jgi:hypothetical protein